MSHSYRILTVSGEIASGTSTLTKVLLGQLPEWNRLNTGDKFRQICSEHGMSIQGVASLPDSVHRRVDDWQVGMAQTGEQIIIESRLAGWLTRDIRDVCRVFCYAPLAIRIKRYSEREGCTISQAREDIQHRDSRDREKYRSMYGVKDYRREEYYSLFLNSAQRTPASLATEVVQFLENPRQG